MKTVFPAPSDQSGVTVVELLVVVIIIAIVAAIALMQRGSANAQFQRQNVATQLKNAFERARFDSVKRRADIADVQAKVVVNSTSYTLTTDKNQDGILDSNDDETSTFSGQNVVVAGTNGVILPVTIVYNQRGEAAATDGTGTVDPVLVVCNVSCSSPTAADSNIVLVTPTGTVNLLPGGSSVPTFSAPGGITNVSANTFINNAAVVTPTP